MKFKRVLSAGKVMASIFWDSQGIIIIDYLEHCHTINGAYYAGKLRQLRQEIAGKRQGELTHGDHAPANTSQVAMTAQLNVDLKSFLIPHILLIWLLLTSICSQN